MVRARATTRCAARSRRRCAASSGPSRRGPAPRRSRALAAVPASFSAASRLRSGTPRDFKVVAAARRLELHERHRPAHRTPATHVLLYVDTIGPGFSDAQYQALRSAVRPRPVRHRHQRLRRRERHRPERPGHRAVHAEDQRAGGRAELRVRRLRHRLLLRRPTSSSSDPNSNKGEIFYSYVPDSTGAYSCPHTAASVLADRAGYVPARAAAHDLVQPARARAWRRRGGRLAQRGTWPDRRGTRLGVL